MEDISTDLRSPTCAIVAAFVEKNPLSPADLPALISAVHMALRATMCSDPGASAPDLAATLRTAAQIRRSITPDAVFSFEDGRGYRSLKRHLTARGMTVAEYKAKWGLPWDYPTTAPNYSALRSQVAKASGLGQVRKPPSPAAERPAKVKIVKRAAPARRKKAAPPPSP